MIEAEKVGTQLRCPPFRVAVVLRPHEESTPRPLVCRVRESEGRGHLAVTAEQRPAALIRIGVDAMLADGVRHAGLEL